MNGFAFFASVLPLIVLFAYGPVTHLVGVRRPSLSQLMDEHRRDWVTHALHRETPLDAILSGNLMNAVSFFASTTALLILALFTVIGQLPEFAPALATITFGMDYAPADLQIHNVAMLVLFVSAFLSFTLSLRQFNHFCILLGAADRTRDPLIDEVRIIARVNALAAQSFNSGIRAYYFAIPMLGWFVSGWLAIVLTLGTLFFLIHREYFSEARWLIARITP